MDKTTITEAVAEMETAIGKLYEAIKEESDTYAEAEERIKYYLQRYVNGMDTAEGYLRRMLLRRLEEEKRNMQIKG